MQEIAQALVNAGVVRTDFESGFTWTSGVRSPIYCDCRELISLPKVREFVLERMLATIAALPEPPTVIAGTATAGIPWAAWVADRLQLPMLYVRSKPKGHGAGKMVEGRCDAGERVLVVEDAISTGGSVVRSAEALRGELGVAVRDVLGVFTWGAAGSAENLAEAGLSLTVYADFAEIVAALQNARQVTAAQAAKLERFQADPAGYAGEFSS